MERKNGAFFCRNRIEQRAFHCDHISCKFQSKAKQFNLPTHVYNFLYHLASECLWARWKMWFSPLNQLDIRNSFFFSNSNSFIPLNLVFTTEEKQQETSARCFHSLICNARYKTFEKKKQMRNRKREMNEICFLC